MQCALFLYTFRSLHPEPSDFPWQSYLSDRFSITCQSEHLISQPDYTICDTEFASTFRARKSSGKSPGNVVQISSRCRIYVQVCA